MAQKSVKTVTAPSLVTNCNFTNEVNFDPHSVSAISDIANALKANAEACGKLAEIFTKGAPLFEAMLKIGSNGND